MIMWKWGILNKISKGYIDEKIIPMKLEKNNNISMSLEDKSQSSWLWGMGRVQPFGYTGYRYDNVANT